MNRDILCIYHANCLDGWGAAMGVIEYFGEENVELVPCAYGDAPPDTTDRRVLIVDFSFPRDVLERMADAAAFVLVWDHHKTAAAALEGIPGIPPIEEAFGLDALPPNALAVEFDMERSGADRVCEHSWCAP